MTGSATPPELETLGFVQYDAGLAVVLRLAPALAQRVLYPGVGDTKVKLVVDHARNPRQTPIPDDGSRPALRLVQGGLTRPSRLVPPSPSPRDPRDLQEEPTQVTPAPVDLDDMPIYLRPIPAWVPRLW
jgi:hypothetical protein